MKHMVTDMEGHNEHVMFSNTILGNYFLESYNGDTILETLSVTESNK